MCIACKQGFESVPSALIKLLESPAKFYPPATACRELAARGLWSHAEQVVKRLGSLEDGRWLVSAAVDAGKAKQASSQKSTHSRSLLPL